MIVIAEDNVTRIQNVEAEILSKYVAALEPYKKEFSNYKAELRVYLSWGTFGNVYTDFVVCEVCDSDGKIIESKDEDLTMDFAWPIAIYRNGSVHFDDEVSDDLPEDMECCADYFKNPY